MTLEFRLVKTRQYGLADSPAHVKCGPVCKFCLRLGRQFLNLRRELRQSLTSVQAKVFLQRGDFTDFLTCVVLNSHV